MKVIILGSSGAMASVVIRDLLEFVPDVSITAADVRPLNFSDSRLRSVIVDVTDEAGAARALEGHDVVINCVTYYFNIHAMKAALRARVPYADLGGLFHGTTKQFALNEDFVRAGIPAILGIGSTPGITNVMAGALASQMDQVQELHVRVACMDESITGPLPVPYSLDTVLDEFALEPWVYKDGKLFPVQRMSGSEVIDFPAPVHKAEALYTLHSEVAMFPRSYPGLREASFKIAFPQEFTQKMRFLVELGFASSEKLIGEVSPRQMLLAVASHQIAEGSEPRDCDVLRVHAKGMKGGRECSGFAESIILPHPQWKIAAGSLDTGVPLSVVSQMLARRRITQPGVLCPEIGVPPEPFFHELKKRGISVTHRIE